jgi:hypothetical protein
VIVVTIVLSLRRGLARIEVEEPAPEPGGPLIGRAGVRAWYRGSSARSRSPATLGVEPIIHLAARCWSASRRLGLRAWRLLSRRLAHAILAGTL